MGSSLAWVAVVLLVVLTVAFGILHVTRINGRRRRVRSEKSTRRVAAKAIQERTPERGVLVPLMEADVASQPTDAVERMLADSLAPVALEFAPASLEEVARLPRIRLNASLQDAMRDILHQVGPKAPTLYKVVLPAGQKLAKAGGGVFHAFARGNNGQIAATAKLVAMGKVGAVGGVALASWPVLAVAGTVMMFDQLALAEQREFQRRVEMHLEAAAVDRRRDRSAQLLAADDALRQAIAMMLDHRPIDGTWEPARLDADQALHHTNLLMAKMLTDVQAIVKDGQKADYKELALALGMKGPLDESFYAELDLARASLVVGQRAAVATAAAAALSDPSNPYTVLRPILAERFDRVTRIGATVRDLLGVLETLELTSAHFRWDRGEMRRMQERLRKEISPPPAAEGPVPIEILVLPSGEMFQVQRTVVAPSEDSADGE